MAVSTSSVSEVAMDTDYAEKTAKIQKETLAKSYAVAIDQCKDIPFSGSAFFRLPCPDYTQNAKAPYVRPNA